MPAFTSVVAATWLPEAVYASVSASKPLMAVPFTVMLLRSAEVLTSTLPA